MSRRAPLSALALLLLVAGCASPAHQRTPAPPETQRAPPAWPSVTLVKVVDGLSQPVLVTGSPSRLFVVEQGGRVLEARNGSLAPEPVLDITSLTRGAGEQGLLGFAVGPDGRAFASYTDLNGDSTVARYRFADPDHLDAASAEVVLHVQQPYANHNGGDVVFGPDGALYLGLGDGGSEGDPHGYGQDASSPLASLLRLDVTASPPSYQIYAKGLRNPWRFSFDRATGDLYVGDVGQDGWEEIDYLPRGAPAGANFGWNAFEGKHVYARATKPFSPVTGPIAEYSHDEGCAVTGGFVYRGARVPALDGAYLYADYCSGKLWGLRSEAGAWNGTLLSDTGLHVSSFGEDDAGDVYVVDHDGAVYRIGS